MCLLAQFGVFSQPRRVPQDAPCAGSTAGAKGLRGGAGGERDPSVLFVALLTGNKRRSLLIITKSNPY